VINKINVEYPEVKNIKIAFVISKKKKLNDVIELFNENQKIKEVNIISMPHMRLMSAEDAHKNLGSLGCSKL
jgi:hypothetical protein